MKKSDKINNVCNMVRKICQDNDLEFLFITDGRSEWSIKENEHIRKVAKFHYDNE